MEQQNRFRSPVLWGAIVAQVIALGQLTGVWARIGIEAGVIGDGVAIILQLLVLVGVMNNPENKEKF